MTDLNPTPTTYADAGVSIDAGNEAVHRMKAHIRSTFTPNVLADVGSFGAMFAFDTYSNPQQPYSRECVFGQNITQIKKSNKKIIPNASEWSCLLIPAFMTLSGWICLCWETLKLLAAGFPPPLA